MLMKNLSQSVNDFVDSLNTDAPHNEEALLCDRPLTKSNGCIMNLVEKGRKIGLKNDIMIKVPLAVYASTFFEQKNPLWLFIIGNPSSNKTTLVDLFKGMDDVFRLDTMTSTPFISGQANKEHPVDLLPTLNGKCFIVKDYSTIFGRPDETVQMLVSDMVSIYDGEFTKHSPSRGTISYESCFSHLGCITPMAIGRRQRYMSSIGARFLFMKVDPLTEKERTECLQLAWDKDMSADKQEMQEMWHEFCSRLKDRCEGWKQISWTLEQQQRIDQLAKLIARARGIIITDKNAEDDPYQAHQYEPVDTQIEEPFRAQQQLRKLTIGLALVDDEKSICNAHILMVRHVALGSMPVRRAQVLSIFAYKNSCTVAEAVPFLNRSERTVRRHLEELVALEVLKTNQNVNDRARTYQLTDDFADVFNWEVSTNTTFDL